MGDYNWSTPAAIGSEWQPYFDQSWAFSSAGTGLAQRIRPGAVTPAALHRFHPDIIGSAPGIALEIVDTLMPPITTTTYFPGTTVAVGGFENQIGGAATYAYADSKTDQANYLRTTGVLGTAEQRTMLFRGASSALSGKRIVAVTMYANVKVQSFTDTADVQFEGTLRIGGNSYYAPNRPIPNTWVWYQPLVGFWRLNPATNLPWTQADINALITAAGSDAFGARVSFPRTDPIVAGGFNLAGIWLDIQTVPENRIGGYFYDSARPLRYWQRYALTAPSVLAANTWYWVVEYPLLGGPGNYTRTGLPWDPSVPEAMSSSSAQGEHRGTLVLTLQNGIVTAVSPDYRTVQGGAVTRGVVGQLFGGLLLEQAAAAINSQSSPYTLVEHRKIASDSAANIGQQVTTAAATAYGAILLPVNWFTPGVQPDRELTIEVRHGAGAITGGGTLDATATMLPTVRNLTPPKIQIPFAAAFTSILNTQYHVIIKSSANPASAWDIIRVDTHSDELDSGTGTTLAMIEGAGQGGTTDSYVEGGTAFSRYEVPLTLIAAPTAPAGLTVTAVAPISMLAPPTALVSWTATSLTTAFKSYKVYGRASRAVARPWALWFEIGVNSGQTAAVVEAQNTQVQLTELGWAAVAGGQWADGWDVGVSVTNANNGLESTISVVKGTTLAPADTSWITSHAAPWLSFPLRQVELADVDTTTFNTYQGLGRDLLLTRSRQELPGRVGTVPWNLTVKQGEDPTRYLRAAAASGRAMALLMPTGDRLIGAVSTNTVTQHVGEPVVGTVVVSESARAPKLSDINMPCGLVTNGSTQVVTVADNTLLNPAASGFTVVMMAAFGAAVSRYALAKGNLGTADGYGFRTTATTNQFQFFVDGATTSGGPIEVNALWFDGKPHVAIGTHSGTAQALYRDGASVATTTVTTGTITNAVALSVGGNNGGATSAMAMNPAHSWAVYLRVLTAAEILAATYYLLGYPGYRMPSNPSVFHDLRDARCWNGLATTLSDLSGNGLSGSVTAATPARALPWPLADLDRF